MKAVIQRVKKAMVEVDGEITGKIGPGILVFLGVGDEDSIKEVDWMADKISGLRIFEDETGKMNLSLMDVEGSALVVSQFTLYGDCRKGKRPSFASAAKPEIANALYEDFIKNFRLKGINTETGRFQAMMDVSLVNDGPVTLIIESPEKKA
ncbi:D-aminoacyl-tRNA deacylase [Desulforegula conservatrix]|uniref:D-aminoacyl-tRNA deacylase n=1 Tax=Desulforegula conservatrix TaxID=153026 RepID=UPI00041FDA0C|nr:D-aminoacyl-tRNA deacylase [Desulforegula conservatrix]